MVGAAALAVVSAGSASAQTSDAPVATAPATGAPQASPTFGAPAAVAPTGANPGGNEVQEVVVTGSRIRQPNLTATSPLTTVNRAEFQLEGTTRVEDLLNNLPQVTASQTSGVSNGATGTATIDLRNLGDQRTLTLIDGRRLVPGDPTDPVGDVNIIPAALVERVDLVTGGASAIYGADAVAGVVNFILQKNFQGVRFDATGEGFLHDNHNPYAEGLEQRAGFPAPSGTFIGGADADVNLTVGVNTPDEKGNVTAYAGYRHIDAVTQANYDYSACSLAEQGRGLKCSGSGTSFSARLDPQTGAAAGDDLFLDTKSGALRNFNSSTDEFNFAPYNYYQRPDTRYTAGAFAHYEVDPKLDFYLQFQFMDDQTDAQIAPSGLFGQTFNISCNNPLLTAAEVTQLCAPGDKNEAINILRRNVEGGGRVDERRHDDFRIVVGGRGDLDANWHYDVYGQYGQSVLSEEYINDVSLSRAQVALNDCRGIGSITTLQGCSPYNIFQPNSVTPAALNYIETPGFENATLTEQVVDASITGQLGAYGLKSPFANDGLSIAAGTEYRREYLNFQTDTEFSSGDLAGQGGPTLSNQGSYDVYEIFGELRVPLVSDKPFVKDLSLDAAYRFFRLLHDRGHQHLFGGGELHARQRHPLPGQLQPRRPCAERE